jgi:hypothetical protein
LTTFLSAFFSLAWLLLSLTTEIHPSSATYTNTAWAPKSAKIRRPRVPANANPADMPRACPPFVVAGLTRLVDGGVFELSAVEETVMGVVIDAATDEGLVILLEDAWKRDDEAAGTMRGAEEVGNAEACACQNSISASQQDHIAIPAQFSKLVSPEYRVDGLPISWPCSNQALEIM